MVEAPFGEDGQAILLLMLDSKVMKRIAKAISQFGAAKKRELIGDPRSLLNWLSVAVGVGLPLMTMAARA